MSGFPYVGAGNSTNKKDAEKNASRDFVNFLVRSGKINENDVPSYAVDPALAPVANSPYPGNVGQQYFNQESPFGGGPSSSSSGSNFNLSDFHSPNQLGQAYRSAQYDNNDFGPQSYMDRAQQQARMEEAESLDVNSAIHGNWSMDNAKSKLYQFMQTNKINAEFTYKSVGPDHNRQVLIILFSFQYCPLWSRNQKFYRNVNQT